MPLRTGVKWMAGLVVVLVFTGCGWAQASTPPHQATDSAGLTEAVKELQQQVAELRAAVAEVHEEAEQYRQVTLALRRELEARAAEPREPEPTQNSTPQPYGNAATPAQEIAPSAASSPKHSAQNPHPDRTQKLEEEYRLLTGELAEQYQTKVESASRYRVRLS